MDFLKSSIVGAVCILATYLQPLHAAMLVLFVIFMADMLFGVLADLIANKKKMNAKKSLIAFAYAAVYLFIIAKIYVIGERMGDKSEALFIGKWITYVFVYFYITNIIRNMLLLFPNSRQIKFLEFVLCLEFTKKIPGLGEFLEKEKKEKEE